MSGERSPPLRSVLELLTVVNVSYPFFDIGTLYKGLKSVQVDKWITFYVERI